MKNTYESPLSSRYASAEMQYLFSPDFKFRTWRRLWIALARAEKTLGLPITEAQIAELERFADDVNYEVAERREREVRHDVMAHIYAYGEQCPSARPILHLGRSCYVGDNTDIIIMRDALPLCAKFEGHIASSDFALRYKDLPALAYTHCSLPSSQRWKARHSVDKRAVMDLTTLITGFSQSFGSKGTTGTRPAFSLFDGDMGKSTALRSTMEMGLTGWCRVVIDLFAQDRQRGVLSVLSGIAQSAYKFSNDIAYPDSRRWRSLRAPPDRPMAMPYKRTLCVANAWAPRPLCDRELPNPAFTAGTQWFERTSTIPPTSA